MSRHRERFPAEEERFPILEPPFHLSIFPPKHPSVRAERNFLALGSHRDVPL